MSAREREPLIFEDSLITVPVSDEAQAVFNEFLAHHLDELTEMLQPFGLDPRKNLANPILTRLVLEGDTRFVKQPPSRRSIGETFDGM